MNGVVVVGISHKTASVELRERFALDSAAREQLARAVREALGVDEVLVLSTCNRTEVYAGALPSRERELEGGAIRELLLRLRPETGADGAAALFELRGLDAVEHAFEVACGLDSMVLGESQILAQLRQAFDEAAAREAIGPAFQELFSSAFRVAKRAHTETAISHGAASIGSVAVELAAKVFDDLASRTVLLLGAGDTGETIARALAERHVGKLRIAGRTVERSSRLAAQFQAEAMELSAALERFGDADIVLTAAAPPAGQYLLDLARVRRGLAARRGDELLLVDVGVPRNVEPAVKDLPDVFLYDLDDLHAVADATLERRQREAAKVKKFIAAAAEAFAAWWRTDLGMAPFLRLFHGHFERVRRRELERALSRLPAEHRELVERFSRSLVDKLLQAPTIKLRNGLGESAAARDLLRELFDLAREESGEEPK